MPEATWIVRPMRDDEREAMGCWAADTWGSKVILSRGVAHDVCDLPAFLAIDFETGEWLGSASYCIEAGECELVQMEARQRSIGIGTALLEAVEVAARAAGSRRIWLTTTNDNLDALRFYQRRGFRLVKVWRDSVVEARHRKPEIPLTGDHGIAINDEIELEMALA